MAASPSGHGLAVSAAIAFVASLIFPISASFANESRVLPRWWGILDVAEASIMLALVIYIAARFRRSVTAEIREASFRSYRVLINVILVVLVIFFVVGDRLTWTYFLPGIAWRTWLMFYAWPDWLAALSSGSAANPGGHAT